MMQDSSGRGREGEPGASPFSRLNLTELEQLRLTGLISEHVRSEAEGRVLPISGTLDVLKQEFSGRESDDLEVLVAHATKQILNAREGKS